jgi:hypothetical protein
MKGVKMLERCGWLVSVLTQLGQLSCRCRSDAAIVGDHCGVVKVSISASVQSKLYKPYKTVPRALFSMGDTSLTSSHELPKNSLQLGDTRIVVNRFTGRTASLPRVAPDPVLSMVLPVPLAYSSKIEVVPQKIQLPSATNSYKLCKVHGGGDLNPGLETCSRPVETVGSTASLHGSVAVGFSVGKDFGQVITGILYAKRWPSSPSQKVKYYHPSWAAIPLIQSDHTDNWLLTSDEP